MLVTSLEPFPLLQWEKSKDAVEFFLISLDFPILEMQSALWLMVGGEDKFREWQS